ncbi:MAG TPA: acyl-CoA dehydrogenase family protein [Amycolatopsis sp.]|nr:acyl-CoA dehydrogenase family protein [Amycolatopsis sp.]
MNLEYDADEQSLLSQAADVFRGIAPLDAAGQKPSVWRSLVDAGWHDLGADVERGTLAAGLAAGVFRAAGHQLLVDQFTSGAYLLSALATHVQDEPDRAHVAAALEQRPGVLLGDGRGAAVPVVDAGAREGYCFGAQGEIDVYRVVDDGGLVLARWLGAPPRVQARPALSPSVATVTVDGDEWRPMRLDLTAGDLPGIETTALLLHSAALIGCAEELLTTTRDYALNRHQFGAPIGSYQAVKHALADVYAANTVAWNAILSAVAEGADTVTAPLVARYLAVEAALGSARAGAQFHGGMGFTAELTVHRFLKTVLDGGQRFGSHDEFAAALGKEMVSRAC